jgi:flagellar assembly protein FliH
MSLSESVVVRKPRSHHVRFVCAASFGLNHGRATSPHPLDPSSTGNDARAGSWVSFEEKAAMDETAQREREYQRGVEDGRKAAEVEGHHARNAWEQEAQSRLETLSTNLKKQHQALLMRMEHDLLKFALAVAERIVRREVRMHDDVVIGQIQEAVRRVVGTETIKLRIHPDDEQAVRGHRGTLLAMSDTVRDLIIEADPMIDQGGCIIESPAGNVDARLSTQLRQIESALFGDVQRNERGDR